MLQIGEIPSEIASIFDGDRPRQTLAEILTEAGETVSEIPGHGVSTGDPVLPNLTVFAAGGDTVDGSMPAGCESTAANADDDAAVGLPSMVVALEESVSDGLSTAPDHGIIEASWSIDSPPRNRPTVLSRDSPHAPTVDADVAASPSSAGASASQSHLEIPTFPPELVDSTPSEIVTECNLAFDVDSRGDFKRAMRTYVYLHFPFACHASGRSTMDTHAPILSSSAVVG